jgi:hypothetical protein
MFFHCLQVGRLFSNYGPGVKTYRYTLVNFLSRKNVNSSSRSYNITPKPFENGFSVISTVFRIRIQLGHWIRIRIRIIFLSAGCSLLGAEVFLAWTSFMKAQGLVKCSF